MDFEILIWDDSKVQHRKVVHPKIGLEDRVWGFLKMYEGTPYKKERIMMPKNMFNIIKFQNTGETLFIIDEEIASVPNSTFTTNYTTGTTFRADQRIMFNATIYDKYANLRNNTRYSDSVTIQIYADGVLLNTHSLVK